MVKVNCNQTEMFFFLLVPQPGEQIDISKVGLEINMFFRQVAINLRNRKMLPEKVSGQGRQFLVVLMCLFS